MHFCNDERPGVTAEMKASAGETFKQTMVRGRAEIGPVDAGFALSF